MWPCQSPNFDKNVQLGPFHMSPLKYRQSDIFTLGQLVDIVNKSAASNIAQRGVDVSYKEWDAFLDRHLHKVKNISRYHHFVFASSEPGKVLVQGLTDSPAELVTTLKTFVTALKSLELPFFLPAGCVTEERPEYLFEEIKPFVLDPFKD